MPDPTIDLGRLQVELRPLRKEELESELAGWLDVLRAKIEQVGEVELKLLAMEGEGDMPPEADPLKTRLVDLKVEERALVERVSKVVDELREKGGDVADAEQYLAAISDIEASVGTASRLAALTASIKTWIADPDGGKAMGKRLLLALLVFGVFWLLSKYAGRLVGKAIGKRKSVSTLLANFARRSAGAVVIAIGALMALGSLGVQIGPLLAAVGAGGFIIGFALQETLGSFASGLMIMIYRPFDVDDYVEVAGVEGKVREMSLVSTTLLTTDNKVLIIPNKSAWGGTITNYTGEKLRRVDLVFGIGYDDDAPAAVALLAEMAAAHELVLDEPEPTVEIVELADSSVNICCRPWVETPNYWRVFWDLTREVKLRFDAEGISIPYPQQDVHLQPTQPANEDAA